MSHYQCQLSQSCNQAGFLGRQLVQLHGAPHLEGLMLSLMLSCHLLEILNFLTSGPAFSFCMEPCKLGNLPLTYILGDRNEEEIGSLFCLERGNEMPRIIPWERFENLAPVPLTQATQYFLWPQGHLPDLDVQDLMIFPV